MDHLDENGLKEFVDTLVVRGLGLYGQEEMAKICYESGVALTDKNEIEWMGDQYSGIVQKLLINYGSRNLPAKMTAIVLARKHGIPVPNELIEKPKKKTGLRKLRFRRRNR